MQALLKKSGLVDMLLDVYQNISSCIPSTTLHVPSRYEKREEESLLLNLLTHHGGLH